MTKRELIDWLEACDAPDDAVVLVPIDDRGDGTLQEEGLEVKVEQVPAVIGRQASGVRWAEGRGTRAAVVIR